MRLLLDTNAFLWWRGGERQLPARVVNELRDPANEIVVSIVSLWEIAIKRALGKLQFIEDFEEVIAEEQFALLSIGYAHLRTFERLPFHHRDPFDRLLIAQASAEQMPMVTSDAFFSRYAIDIIW